jgi:hypothetical protein
MPATAGATLPDGRAEASEAPGGAATQEAGAQENILVISPGDENFAFAQDWEDGKEYVFHELKVRQVSPGKFTPISAEGGEEATEEATEPSEEGMMGEGMGKKGRKGYPGSTVAQIMGSEQE